MVGIDLLPLLVRYEGSILQVVQKTGKSEMYFMRALQLLDFLLT